MERHIRSPWDHRGIRTTYDDMLSIDSRAPMAACPSRGLRPLPGAKICPACSLLVAPGQPLPPCDLTRCPGPDALIPAT